MVLDILSPVIGFFGSLTIAEILGIAGFVISSVVGILTLYFNFFRKPKLKMVYNAKDNVEEEDKRWGIIKDREVIAAWEEKQQNPEVIDPWKALLRNLPAGFYPKRRFINVQVNNRGRAVARNCEVKIKILENSDGCSALDIREKSLLWKDGQPRIDIGVRSRKIFHLAFSQQRLTYDQKGMMGTVYCELERRKVEPKAWIATEKALEDQADSKGDGMCRGTFKVHVDVTEENGNMDSKHFVIKVRDD